MGEGMATVMAMATAIAMTMAILMATVILMDIHIDTPIGILPILMGEITIMIQGIDPVINDEIKG